MTIEKDAAAELALGFFYGLAALGFFLACGQCCAANAAKDGARYTACMQATKSVQECGRL